MIDRICISINARCNLSCPYCHFGKKVNVANPNLWELTEKEMITILDNVLKYVDELSIKTFKIGIVGSGEPMLSFNIIKKAVEYVSTRRINVLKFYTITNGTLMSDEQLQYFHKHKDVISLNFSLDGFKSLHELFRQDFTKTYRNIVKYEELFNEKPIINVCVNRNTLKHKDQVIDFLINNQFRKANFSIVFGTRIDSVSISKEEYYQFLESCRQSGIIMRQLSKSNSYDCAKYGHYCGVGKNNIYYTKQGVYPCARFQGLEEYLLGQLSDDLLTIEHKLTTYKPAPDGECFYEYYGMDDV